MIDRIAHNKCLNNSEIHKKIEKIECSNPKLKKNSRKKKINVLFINNRIDNFKESRCLLFP